MSNKSNKIEFEDSYHYWAGRCDAINEIIDKAWDNNEYITKNDILILLINEKRSNEKGRDQQQQRVFERAIAKEIV